MPGLDLEIAVHRLEYQTSPSSKRNDAFIHSSWRRLRKKYRNVRMWVS